MTIIVALGLCAAAYGFLGAYALNAMRQDQLTVQQNRLRVLKQRQQELVHQKAVLKQAAQFSRRARELGLQESDWSYYDVNVQAPLVYDAAREVIHQCGDSASAYFWPVSLELKVPEKEPANTPSQAQRAGPTDVQLSVKGRFVAKR